MTITVKYKTQRNRWNPALLFDTDKDDVGSIIFDYGGELGGDAVSTATATTSNITAGTPSVSGNVVTVAMSAGKAGTTAKMELKITTTGGKTLSNTVRFRVTDNYEVL